MKGIIVGKNINTYTDKSTGEAKTSRTLYVLWDKPKNPTDGFEGCKCESVFVPFEIPPDVELYSHCEFEYEIQQTRVGSMARLVDIIPDYTVDISISPIV